VQSIQNEYSLLCRLYDTDHGELAVNEQVTLLAYSPLAAGLLTGKYQNGALPRGEPDGDQRRSGRAQDRPRLCRRRAYLALAKSTGSTRCIWRWPLPCSGPFRSRPSLARPRRTSWRISCRGCDVTLSAELLEEIDTTCIKAHPMPF
jgi:aryl-alcohol dehydrogenase-like predicted oxidoreductase